MGNIIFKEKVKRHVKRMIGFTDVEQESETFGCADRGFWHYKLNDYSNARMQELCLILAFCHQDREGEFYKNGKLLELIEGVIDFWIKKRNKNGSVNEIFPHEQSFCATAFSTFIITETIELLDLDKEKYRSDLERTGDWLLKNANWHIANQITASIAALYNLKKMYSKEKFGLEFEKRLGLLLENHKRQGYFSEYGGFDLGYTTITMSLLARIYQKSGIKEIHKALKESEKKVSKYLDNYARYDNINMSRKTNFVFPFGFKVIDSFLMDRIENGITNDKILNPDWLDDRYLVGLSNDYLMTYFW